MPLALFDMCAPGAAMAIGALPALADGDLPRTLTQEWARAIYEDQPAPRRVTGLRYRSAYNGGISLALWDSAAVVATLNDAAGHSADLALADVAMLDRVKVACVPRRISVDTIASTSCARCRRLMT